MSTNAGRGEESRMGGTGCMNAYTGGWREEEAVEGGGSHDCCLGGAGRGGLVQAQKGAPTSGSLQETVSRAVKELTMSLSRVCVCLCHAFLSDLSTRRLSEWL